MFTKFIGAAVVATALAVSPAFAAEFTYSAALSGNQAPTQTGSPASGTASLRVDTEAQTVALALSVTGLSFDSLSDHLTHSAMGPVHLHLYKPNGDVELILPFPFGASYAETAHGFTINVSGYKYADAVAHLEAPMSFEAFAASLQSDFVYLNVHTDAFPDGEISGRLDRRGPSGERLH